MLSGEPAPSARRDLSDLADTRDAVVDEGIASRKLLASLASDLGLEGLLVVTSEALDKAGETPRSTVRARLFEASSGNFAPIDFRAGDDGAWDGAVGSIERLVPPAAASVSTAPGTAPAKNATKEGHKSFYESPWFWGAAAAAVVLGGGFFLATRDSNSDSIHVQMQVPR